MSKPRHFYRIEHKPSQIGPYNAIVRNKRTGLRESFRWLIEENFSRGLSTSVKNCPTPLNEGSPERIINNSDSRYGFSSLSKLRKWFGTNKKLYAILEEYDFVLKKFTVNGDDMFQSPTQCIVMVGDLVEFEELPFSAIFAPKKACSAE